MRLRLLDKIGVVLDPRFWIRAYPVNHKWSDDLDALLDSGEPMRALCDDICKIGDRDVWTSDYTYAFGWCWDVSADMLPRRRTTIRLRQRWRERLDLDAPDPRSLALPVRDGGGAIDVAGGVAAAKGKTWNTTDATTP